jgi:hypothetical protein
LKWYLIARAIVGHQEFTEKEANTVWKVLAPIYTDWVILATALCLILLIVSRVNWMFR